MPYLEEKIPSERKVFSRHFHVTPLYSNFNFHISKLKYNEVI